MSRLRHPPPCSGDGESARCTPLRQALRFVVKGFGRRERDKYPQGKIRSRAFPPDSSFNGDIFPWCFASQREITTFNRKNGGARESFSRGARKPIFGRGQQRAKSQTVADARPGSVRWAIDALRKRGFFAKSTASRVDTAAGERIIRRRVCAEALVYSAYHCLEVSSSPGDLRGCRWTCSTMSIE